MRKFITILVAVLSLSWFFTSCASTKLTDATNTTVDAQIEPRTFTFEQFFKYLSETKKVTILSYLETQEEKDIAKFVARYYGEANAKQVVYVLKATDHVEIFRGDSFVIHIDKGYWGICDVYYFQIQKKSK